MGLVIEDGKGRGNSAGVDDENRLTVTAITESIEHHVNHHNGNSFNCVFSQSPTASGDCIFYMINSDDDDMIIEGITFGVVDATANDSLYFKLGDSGTRASATALTPVNINAGSGKSASGTFEKGVALNGGTLAGGTEFERLVIAGATDVVSKNLNFEQDIVLQKNNTLTMWVDGSGTGTYYITVHFFYHN